MSIHRAAEHWRGRGACVRAWCACVLLACVAGGSAGPAASDWPQWRGPERSGISREAGLATVWPPEGPRVLWRASIGKGFSSFAVAGGRVYTMGNTNNEDTVFCFDALTGKAIWKHTYACPALPLSYEGGPSATPAVDGDRVYTLSKFGHCFCLDAGTGRPVWSRKFDLPVALPEDYRVFWGFAGSPLVLGKSLILAVGSAGTALDKRDSRVLWSSGTGRPGYSSPVPFRAGGRECFAFLGSREVIAVSAEDGAVLWRVPWRTTWDQNAPDVTVSEAKVFASSGHGVGAALFDIAKGAPVEVWRSKQMRNELSSSVLWNGHLYGFDARRLTCLEWATGAVRWSAEGLGQGTLLVADGRLVLLSEDGSLVLAEAAPEAYRPLAKAQILSGRCWSAPALAGRRLYARNAAGDVVCVDLAR